MRREFMLRHADRINYTKTMIARRIRLEVINAYGGKCCVCGESDPVVLELDHINGLNSVDPTWARGGVGLHRAIRRAGFPQGLFQVLCANCHRRKTFAAISRQYDDQPEL
jgi:5-methylcytosine-specific restriction endonuclease McrA